VEPAPPPATPSPEPVPSSTPTLALTPAPPEAAYVVLGPDGAIARAITAEAACPDIAIDGRPVRMHERAAPDARFAVRVCEAVLPATVKNAAIGAQALPLPVADPRRIVAFGDTGCRLKAQGAFHEFQACNDPAQWPFALVSATAAAWHPDLVIHVGDYQYRESLCPADDKGCAGSPIGDDWPAWKADFFDPAKPLLETVPWVMVRGNHENCSRAGTGYFRFLDPRAMPADCVIITAPYTVKLGARDLVVLDSGEASDADPDDKRLAIYRAEFERLHPAPHSWLVTHRPLWALDLWRIGLPSPELHAINATLQAASKNALPKEFSLVLAGHIHAFEALAFADGRQPQLVVGTGGSLLSEDLSQLQLPGQEVAGTKVSAGRIAHRYGYTTLEPAGNGWTATFHDPDGKQRFACAIDGADVRCLP
jgi:hypothetical protein